MADVQRGPDWLFVRLTGEATLASDNEIADGLWDMLRRHFAHRMVVELNEIPQLSNCLLAQLVTLGDRIKETGGMLRLSGLSPEAREELHAAQLDRLLPCFADCNSAVMGNRPLQPR
jgi:anti-anti-sigma factor